MASEERQVEVIIVPEMHGTAGEEFIIKNFIPEIKKIIPINRIKILNFTEGTGIKPPTFFKALYTDDNFTHMFEYRDLKPKEVNPDLEYGACLKLVLAIYTIIRGTLDILYFKKRAGYNINSKEVFANMFGRSLTHEYLGYLIKGYYLDKIVDFQHPIFARLNTAYLNIRRNGLDTANYDVHINNALRLLIEIINTKDCQEKDKLIASVNRLISAENADIRKDVILKETQIVRELSDDRNIAKIEKFLSTDRGKTITHIIMNVGENHYSNLYRKINLSPLLTINVSWHAYILSVYREPSMRKLITGGRKKTIYRNKKKKTHRKILKSNKSKN